jgi:hypothetical protein
MSTLSWGLAGITIRSNNPYLKDLDIMVKLKRGNDAIAFFSSTFYDEIWLRYKGKFYQIQSSRNGKGVGVFYIGEPFNLDGTKTDNFYLCEMLNLPTKN